MNRIQFANTENKNSLPTNPILSDTSNATTSTIETPTISNRKTMCKPTECIPSSTHSRSSSSHSRPPMARRSKPKKQISFRDLGISSHSRRRRSTSTKSTELGDSASSFNDSFALDTEKSSELRRSFTVRRRKPKKTVTFDEFATVQPIPHISQYTDEEMMNCWYTPEEKQEITLEIKNSIKMIKRNSPNTERTCSLRGLERLSKKGKELEKRRKLSILEIMNEQESQRAKTKAQNSNHILYDTKSFRKIYKQHSKAALKMAQAMAKADEVAVAHQFAQQSHHTRTFGNDSSGSIHGFMDGSTHQVYI